MKKNNLIQKSNRIVIKIGSALLIDKNKGALKNKWLESLALDICDLIKLKKEVVVVSSGSIALGKKQLELNNRALILDCHSFPEIPMKRSQHKIIPRPDYNIGTDKFHTPKKLIDISKDLSDYKEK